MGHVVFMTATTTVKFHRLIIDSTENRACHEATRCVGFD